MKKYILYLISIFCLAALHANAQQLGQFNLAAFNPYLYNPASSNSLDQNELNLGFRKQWTGFGDGPSTFYFFGIMNINAKGATSYKPYSIRISNPDEYQKYQPQPKIKYRQTMGGWVFNDDTKFNSHTAMSLSYAIGFKLGEEKDKELSLGTYFGIKNFSFDRSQVTVLEGNDQTYTQFLSYNESTLYYDFGLSLYLDAPSFFFGYSAMQIPGESFTAGGAAGGFEIPMHHFISAGFKKKMGEEELLVLKPAIIARIAGNLPTNIDFSITATYDQKYWGGIMYRNAGSLALMLGTSYKNTKLGYAFDLGTTGIRSYNSGSHEIMLARLF